MYKTEKEISAGGVVFRKNNNSWEVVLINRKNGSIWCLPKGKIEKDEKMEDAAVREVKEETGLEAETAGFINAIHYWYIDKKRNLRLNKTVHFFLMKCNGGDTKTHDQEVDAVEWFFIDEAIERETYMSERQTIEKAKMILSSEEGKK